MLTFERHERILNYLKNHSIAKLADLVKETGASDSTIRRDLTELENSKKLKRIHGGASLIKSKLNEPSLSEKTTRFKTEKQIIGKLAASCVQDGDSLYIDAGTTTEAMLSFITAKDIVIVTNGLNIIDQAVLNGFKTYVIGGHVKSGTRAFVGKGAVEAISDYRFDRAFIGTNGIDLSFGFSTPDPEEAHLKKLAISYAQHSYVMADSSKFREISFSTFADVKDATLLTSYDEEEIQYVEKLKKLTSVKEERSQ